MSPANFLAKLSPPEIRQAGFPISVTIAHVPQSTNFVLSVADARALAFCILRSTDEYASVSGEITEGRA